MPHQLHRSSCGKKLSINVFFYNKANKNELSHSYLVHIVQVVRHHIIHQADTIVLKH